LNDPIRFGTIGSIKFLECFALCYPGENLSRDRRETRVSLQPLLNELVATLSAPTSALSGADGQIRADGVQGVFHADRRVLSEAVLRLDGREPEPIGRTPEGTFVAVARWLGESGADPRVRVERRRTVTPAALTEDIAIVSTAAVPVSTVVTVTVAADLAPIEAVKSGLAVEPRTPETVPDGSLTWADDSVSAVATSAAGPFAAPAPAGSFRWEVTVAPGERADLRWELHATDPAAVVAPPPPALAWPRAEVRADDHRLARLVDRSLADLRDLRLTDPGHPEDVYLAAGVPWFLTLFGRDSIWAARMLLPLGTEPALGTLRVLARRQGRRVDPETGEAPGKIMHELRRAEFALPGPGIRLPATYYGTIDATPLWISLLHDAWRWGLPASAVVPLIPHLEAALGWLGDHADPDGDGFLEYIDTSGRGLANQGWKDSGDAVRFHDGRLAEPPIALAEVQGYAYRAALDGAALLDAFDRPGADRWRSYADAMATRFRARFWVDGGWPALALDRDKRPVDSLTSNIGHLLATGLLSADEEKAVAEALASEAMSGGFGLRTMSADDAGYAPLSYHCGSVWTHDTAIVAAGLARTGHAAAAGTLIDGLLAAADTFDYRLPELHAGFGRSEFSRPMAYPAACRPQAWSAAAAILILQAWLGLEPDVPNGVVRVRPLPHAPMVKGLRIAGQPVDFDGLSLVGLPARLTVKE
jgi:glycogen debranching enzyme